MKHVLLLAVFIFLNIVCYAAEVPLQCAPAPSSSQPAKSSQSVPSQLNNEEVIFFLVTRSTNTPAYCYALARSGAVIKKTGASRFQTRPGQPVPSEQKGSMPASQADQIFSDVEAAMPLSALPKTPCAKSVSFGTSQYVFFKGEKTPDLCGHDNEKIEALKGDLAKIMSTAKFAQAKP